MKRRTIRAAVLAAVMILGTAVGSETASAASYADCGAAVTQTGVEEQSVLLGAGKLAAPTEFTKYAGSETFTLTWNKVEGADAYKILLYDSGKKKYAEVRTVTKNSCQLTGLAPSTAYKIKVVTYDKVNGKLVKQSTSKVQTCKTVKEPTALAVSVKSKTLKAGKSVTVTAAVKPAAFSDVRWTISDKNVAKISGAGASCKVTALQAGTATLTATAGGRKAGIAITVKVEGAAGSATSAGDFQYQLEAGSVTIKKYVGKGGAVVIPDEIEGKPVTKIMGSAFYACEALESLALGRNVEEIGEWAFCDCVNLKELKLEGNLAVIGGFAFRGCKSLKSVKIPNSVTTIGEQAFRYCDSLTEIVIPDNVTELGCYAFCEDPELASVTLGRGITVIERYTFFECSNLTSITIPDSVTYIAYHAFGYCGELVDVAIPDSVTTISKTAFDQSAKVKVSYKGRIYDYDHVDAICNILDVPGNPVQGTDDEEESE